MNTKSALRYKNINIYNIRVYLQNMNALLRNLLVHFQIELFDCKNFFITALSRVRSTSTY